MAAAAAPCTHALTRALARCRGRGCAPDYTATGACTAPTATHANCTAARVATARVSAGRVPATRAIASPVVASVVAIAVGGSIPPLDRPDQKRRKVLAEVPWFLSDVTDDFVFEVDAAAASPDDQSGARRLRDV